MHHGEIVNLIKDSGYSVVLTVGPPIGEFTFLLTKAGKSPYKENVTTVDVRNPNGSDFGK